MRLVSLLVGEWCVTDTFLYSKILLRRPGILQFSASGWVRAIKFGQIGPPQHGRAADHKLECVRPKRDGVEVILPSPHENNSIHTQT